MDSDVSARLQAVKDRINNFREALKSPVTSSDNKKHFNYRSPNPPKVSLDLIKNNKLDSSVMSKSSSSSDKHLDNDSDYSNEERKPKYMAKTNKSGKNPKLRKEGTMKKSSHSNHQQRSAESKQRDLDNFSDGEVKDFSDPSDYSDSSSNLKSGPKLIFVQKEKKKNHSKKNDVKYLRKLLKDISQTSPTSSSSSSSSDDYINNRKSGLHNDKKKKSHHHKKYDDSSSSDIEDFLAKLTKPSRPSTKPKTRSLTAKFTSSDSDSDSDSFDVFFSNKRKKNKSKSKPSQSKPRANKRFISYMCFDSSFDDSESNDLYTDSDDSDYSDDLKKAVRSKKDAFNHKKKPASRNNIYFDFSDEDEEDEDDDSTINEDEEESSDDDESESILQNQYGSSKKKKGTKQAVAPSSKSAKHKDKGKGKQATKSAKATKQSSKKKNQQIPSDYDSDYKDEEDEIEINPKAKTNHKGKLFDSDYEDEDGDDDYQSEPEEKQQKPKRSKKQQNSSSNSQQNVVIKVSPPQQQNMSTTSISSTSTPPPAASDSATKNVFGNDTESSSVNSSENKIDISKSKTLNEAAHHHASYLAKKNQELKGKSENDPIDILPATTSGSEAKKQNEQLTASDGYSASASASAISIPLRTAPPKDSKSSNIVNIKPTQNNDDHLLSQKKSSFNIENISDNFSVSSEDEELDVEAEIQKLTKPIATTIKAEEKKEEICSVKECDEDDDFAASEFYDYDAIQCIKIIREISLDNFTKVFEISMNDDKKYAMKQLRKDKVTFPNFQRLLAEYNFLKYLDHPGIVKPNGIYMSDVNTPPFFTFESFQMDLSSFIGSQESLAPEKARKILFEVADAMKYAHDKNVIHGNLNPSQILIYAIEKVKILGIINDDFIYNQEHSIFTAPEILKNDHYNGKIDVYSFGFLVYFVMNDGKLPEISSQDILSGKRPNFPEKFDTFSQELVVSCLKSDPNERPSFIDICNLFIENFE